MLPREDTKPTFAMFNKNEGVSSKGREFLSKDKAPMSQE